MGQLGVLGVCEVSVTNVKRKRVKAQNDQLPSRSGFLCCQKIALSFAAGEWLAGHSMLCMASSKLQPSMRLHRNYGLDEYAGF